MSIASKIRKQPEEGELPITPMIDIVFLLLMYFMLSSTIQRQEADLRFSLPGTVSQSVPLDIPDEQIILITEDGQAILNDFAYDSPDFDFYEELAGALARYRESCEANLGEAKVILKPEDRTKHESIVKVMDACSLAGIGTITFSE